MTKYRYQIFQGDIALRIRELVRQVCERLEIRFLRGVVSKDHVHIVVSAPPEIAPSEIMRRIKGQTSVRIFEKYPTIKKGYWERHFRARGYFCVTAGELTKEMIQEYLSYHFERDSNDGFDIEPAAKPAGQ